jgi:hypothetical protein
MARQAGYALFDNPRRSLVHDPLDIVSKVLVKRRLAARIDPGVVTVL